MSDLISRSELLKEIEKYKFGAISNNAEREYIKKTILDFINFQPTVYDIDKVVEELEERTDFLKGCAKYGNKNAKQQDKSYDTMMMYEVADLADDLIEIVKSGGVSDDCCEWKIFDNSLNNEPQWVYETTCGKYIGEEHTSKAFVYCPYCGKKIKVVEKNEQSI